MGDHPIHDATRQQELIEGLSQHPTTYILFIKNDEKFAGFATCFVNFSTFRIKPFLYIHDVFVQPGFRGKRLGKMLMEKLVETAKESGYCKVTLEVREDNKPARTLYQSLGFEAGTPDMFYWEKIL
jgi:ribosomal protein S18 acetylase RimI-like enzyme